MLLPDLIIVLVGACLRINVTPWFDYCFSRGMSTAEYSSLPAVDVENISGDIFVPSAASDDNTLDEPVTTTLVGFLL